MSADLFVPRTVLEHKLVTSLWSFRSSYWNGYVDFRGPGHYWTHWGFGTWRSLDERTIRMENSYDMFWFVLAFDASLVSFHTQSSNHQTRPEGEALYFYATGAFPIGHKRLRVADDDGHDLGDSLPGRALSRDAGDL